MPISVEEVIPKQDSARGTHTHATVVFRAKIHVTDREEVMVVGSCKELGADSRKGRAHGVVR